MTEKISDLFVPYDLSLIAREERFNEPCLGYYVGKDREVYTSNQDVEAPFNPELNSNVWFRAPIWEQIVDWFDKKHKIRIDLTHANSNGAYTFDIWKWNYDNNVGKWERLFYIGTYLNPIDRNRKAVEEAFKLIRKN
jgi:hypothetical protein